MTPLMTARRLLLAGLLIVCVATNAAEGNDTVGSPRLDPPVELILGNGLWHGGTAYKSADGWFALVCRQAMECSFERGSLDVEAEQWQGHYDEKPTDGQKLTFKRATAGSENERVIGWFRPHSTVPGIAAGAVISYSFGPRTGTRGTGEITMQPAVGAPWHLVPLLDKGESEYGNTFVLQLRSSQLRQMLDGALGGECGWYSGDRNYLLWAGDLDRDRKPDFVLEGGSLYLSSLAAPEQLVGLAGRSPSAPFGGECDGFVLVGPRKR